MVRGALAALLAMELDLEVVAQVGRGDEVVPLALESEPDVALLDIEMPGLDGLSAAAQLRAGCPACRVVILTTFGRPGYLRRAMEAGATGFLLKDAPVCAARRRDPRGSCAASGSWTRCWRWPRSARVPTRSRSESAKRWPCPRRAARSPISRRASACPRARCATISRPRSRRSGPEPRGGRADRRLEGLVGARRRAVTRAAAHVPPRLILRPTSVRGARPLGRRGRAPSHPGPPPRGRPLDAVGPRPDDGPADSRVSRSHVAVDRDGGVGALEVRAGLPADCRHLRLHELPGRYRARPRPGHPGRPDDDGRRCFETGLPAGKARRRRSLRLPDRGADRRLAGSRRGRADLLRLPATSPRHRPGERVRVQRVRPDAPARPQGRRPPRFGRPAPGRRPRGAGRLRRDRRPSAPQEPRRGARSAPPPTPCSAGPASRPWRSIPWRSA